MVRDNTCNVALYGGLSPVPREGVLTVGVCTVLPGFVTMLSELTTGGGLLGPFTIATVFAATSHTDVTGICIHWQLIQSC